MDGGVIDGGWYLDVVGFARSTPWLHGFFEIYTDAGLGLLAVLAAVVWWRGRGKPAEVMAAALWVPLGVLLAYVPSLGEQCVIAGYLDRETARIDALIEEQQRLIEMLRGAVRLSLSRPSSLGSRVLP